MISGKVFIEGIASRVRQGEGEWTEANERDGKEKGRKRREEGEGEGWRGRDPHQESGLTISKWKLGEQNQQSLGNESLFGERAGHLRRELFVLERSLGNAAMAHFFILTCVVEERQSVMFLLIEDKYSHRKYV